MTKYFLLAVFSFSLISVSAQSDRWQQRVKYTMNIDMNVQTNQYKGKQKLEYWNNSPDTLKRVYYHLYFNAFQPNSMMDVRSQRQGSVVLRQDRNGNDITDWDARVKDRIANLKENEIGYQRINSLKMNGRSQKIRYHETILEVVLDKPILPKTKVTFDMEWDAQVPVQIRRSGRDNPNTTVRYTMTQWYPKMAEYDYEGWHPEFYVAREFYGVWGDFDVSINIDNSYVLGGTGYLQNPNTIGHGYEDKGVKVTHKPGGKLNWRFIAPNVHDFAWAADPNYIHLKRTIPNGPAIHVLYKNRVGREKDDEVAWNRIADGAVTVYPFIKSNFGEYAHKQYSFIHGGDGGMEYPMATMLSSASLGTAFHEWMHSWYQMMLGTNESMYAWMDEGFTEYSTNLVEEFYRQKVVRPNIADPNELRKSDSAFVSALPLYHAPNYTGYISLAKSGREEPLTTHADHFNTNYAYSNAAYSKGAVFMEQLGYIVGASVRDHILLHYYKDWRFKHPNADDLIRIAEKQSGIELDWYKMYWVNTTKTIDYGIDSLYESSGSTRIRLERIGQIPMPIDVRITFKDGSTEWHYIPLNLMFGNKPVEKGQEGRIDYEAWKWTHGTYEIDTKRRLNDIIAVEIDPTKRMADIEAKNNKLELKW